MAKFKINNCFNERLKNYINNHSFTKEIAKFGLVDTIELDNTTTWMPNTFMPFIYVVKTKEPLLVSNIDKQVGVNAIQITTGKQWSQYYTPEYVHWIDSNHIDMYIIAQYSILNSNKDLLTRGTWCNSACNIMLIPYSALGISTREVLVRMFERLDQITTTSTIVLGSYALSQLSDEDKKIATDKGWTLA